MNVSGNGAVDTAIYASHPFAISTNTRITTPNSSHQNPTAEIRKYAPIRKSSAFAKNCNDVSSIGLRKDK